MRKKIDFRGTNSKNEQIAMKVFLLIDLKDSNLFILNTTFKNINLGNNGIAIITSISQKTFQIFKVVFENSYFWNLSQSLDNSSFINSHQIFQFSNLNVEITINSTKFVENKIGNFYIYIHVLIKTIIKIN